MRAALHLLAALAWIAVATAALAAGPELNLDRGRLALRGFDPVAYFTAGRAMSGLPAFTLEHDGAIYLFATAANRDAFRADPARYLPQYGGYCAYAAALGKKADADPAIWHVKDGRLFLNYNRSIGETWSRDIDGYVAKADRAWPTIRARPAAELE